MSESQATPPAKTSRSVFKITDAKFQTSILLFTFGIGLLTTLTSLVCLHLVITSLSNSAIDIRSMDWDQIEKLIKGQVTFAWTMMIVLGVINLSATALLTFLFSNRVSGLIFRIRKSLQAWLDGEPVEPIHPRKGDFFDDLVEVVNETIKRPRT